MMARQHDNDIFWQVTLITPAGKPTGRTVTGAELRRLTALGFRVATVKRVAREDAPHMWGVP